MSQEESIADILKSGRKKRRRNGLFKSSHQGRKRRAKMPVFEKPWHNPAPFFKDDGTEVTDTKSQS